MTVHGIQDLQQGRPQVPADRRLFGFDKRSYLFAIPVLLIIATWLVVFPRINDATTYEDHIRSGDHLSLAENIQFTPKVDWQLNSGHRIVSSGRQQSGQVQLTSRGVTLVITPGAFDGTPDALLDQVDKVTTQLTKGEGFHVSEDRIPLKTKEGDVGVAQAYSSARAEGVIAALVINGTGLKIQIVGPPDQISAISDEVAGMVESIRTTGTNGAAA